MNNPKTLNQSRRVIVSERLHRDGKWQTFEKGEAKFCCFSTDHEEYENGPGPFPAAVVEWPDGKLESFHVSFIRFVKDSPADETTTTEEP